MPSITISRSIPFTRGNESIQILIDEKQVGSLLRDPLTIELSPGTHTLQAQKMNMRGKKEIIDIGENESLVVYVKDINKFADAWWQTAIFLAILLMPDRLFYGYAWYIRIGLVMVQLGFSIHAYRKFRKDHLQLAIVQPSKLSDAASTLHPIPSH